MNDIDFGTMKIELTQCDDGTFFGSLLIKKLNGDVVIDLDMSGEDSASVVTPLMRMLDSIV